MNNNAQLQTSAVLLLNGKKSVEKTVGPRYKPYTIPYGYMVSEDVGGGVVIDELASKNIQRIFELRADGASPNRIARILNDEGTLPPADYKEQRFGVRNTRGSHHLWSGTAVKQLLNNSVYVSNDLCESIISRELWDNCLVAKEKASRTVQEATKRSIPLSGKVYCADCGAKMHIGQSGGSRGDPRNYFNCGSFSKFGDRCCFNHYIKSEDINRIVLNDIRVYALEIREDMGKVRMHLLANSADGETVHQTECRLNEIETLIAKVYEDKVAGRIAEDVCNTLLSKYSNEMKRLKEDLELSGTPERVDRFISTIKKYAYTDELSREMCDELIEFVLVDGYYGRNTARDIHICYKYIGKMELPERRFEAKKP